MPYSHHSHSGQFCRHATGTLEDVVLAAIRQDFKVYALTEHVPRYRPTDLYPEEVGMSMTDLLVQFEAFLDEAHRLKTEYASRIVLLVGAETEYITERDLIGLDALLQKHGHRIEFLVGSVHHVAGQPIDFDKPTFEALLDSLALPACGIADVTQMEALMCAYFDAQYDVLRRFRPEIVAHLDLCRLYFPSTSLSACPDVWSKIERNVRFAIEYGALFEFNASAFRKGWKTAYPGFDAVELIFKLGGRFTLSDDSHGPHAVGLNYDRLYQYLRDLGIRELWYLSAGAVPNAAGRLLVPMRVEGQWWGDLFWEGKGK